MMMMMMKSGIQNIEMSLVDSTMKNRNYNVEWLCMCHSWTQKLDHRYDDHSQNYWNQRAAFNIIPYRALLYSFWYIGISIDDDRNTWYFVPFWVCVSLAVFIRIFNTSQMINSVQWFLKVNKTSMLYLPKYVKTAHSEHFHAHIFRVRACGSLQIIICIVCIHSFIVLTMPSSQIFFEIFIDILDTGFFLFQIRTKFQLDFTLNQTKLNNKALSWTRSHQSGSFVSEITSHRFVRSSFSTALDRQIR